MQHSLCGNPPAIRTQHRAPKALREKTMVHAKSIASVMPFFDSQSGAFEFRQASSPPPETACRVVPTKPTHKTFTVEIGRGINLAFFFSLGQLSLLLWS